VLKEKAKTNIRDTNALSETRFKIYNNNHQLTKIRFMAADWWQAKSCNTGTMRLESSELHHHAATYQPAQCTDNECSRVHQACHCSTPMRNRHCMHSQPCCA